MEKLPGEFPDIVMYVSSVLGLVASLCLAVLGIFSFPAPLSGFAALLGKVTMFALLPVGILYVYRLQKANYERTQREADMLGLSGCPHWMRHPANILMVLGVILFFLPGVLEFLGYIPKSDGTTLPSTTPGGFGMLAYTGMFVQLYSANAANAADTARPQGQA